MRLAGAVDIGGTRTKIGIVGDDGSIVTRSSIPTTTEPALLVTRIAESLRPKLDVYGSAIGGIGVSVAGFLDRGRTRMYGNANLPALCEFPLKAELERQLSRDCVLEVDSNASTVAEFRFGAGRGASRLLALTIGTGVGGGVILDGALLRHTGQCAGDIGHVIVSLKGRRCTCGATGCMEAMVCAAAVSDWAGGRSISEVIRANDKLGREALAEAGNWLGIGLASLAPHFLPDRIVVGGGVAVAGDRLLDVARANYRSYVSTALRDVPIVGSSFDGWEGMIGAGSQALNPID